MTQIQAAYWQPETPIFEPYVDEHAVAQLLKLTPRRVLELARKEEIPAHPIGNIRKIWRFRLSEIENHFNRRPEPQRSATIALAVPATQGRNHLG